MKPLLTAGLFLLSTACLSSVTHAEQNRIINGKRAQISQYPWLASLFIASVNDPQSGGGCGGSLIASRWVLTAAHCFLTEDGNAVSEGVAARTTVTLNTTNINESISSNAIVSSASRVIVHPNYNPNKTSSQNTHDFDIALVELSTSVSITPVRLYTGALPTGMPTIVAGWGATKGDGTSSSDDLLATQLLVSKPAV